MNTHLGSRQIPLLEKSKKISLFFIELILVPEDGHAVSAPNPVRFHPKARGLGAVR
jgi:hypothetical protein